MTHQPGNEVTPTPQIPGRTGLAYEFLNRAHLKENHGGLKVTTRYKAPLESRSDRVMVPGVMVGNSRIGRKVPGKGLLLG